MTTKKEILDYLASFQPQLEQEGLTKLGLFGSYARGRGGWGSDIDIVIQTTPRFMQTHPGWEALKRLEGFRQEVSNHFGGVRVDLCDLTGLSPEKAADLLEGAVYV